MKYIAIRTLLAACVLLCLGAAAIHAAPPVDVTILPGGGNAVAVDAAGNIYVTGSADAQSLPGAHHPVDNDSVGEDVYVAKLDPTGRLLFQTVFGGRHWDEGLSISVDAQGRIYVVGITFSWDFADPDFTGYHEPGEFGPPSDQIHYGGGFLAALDPTGSTVLYSEILSENEESVKVTDVAVTPDGRAYFLSMAGPDHIPYVNVFKANGGPVAYPQLWLGCEDSWPSWSYLTGLATDPAGNLYVSGTVYVEADVEYGVIGQAYVEKLDPRGAHIYSACLGSADHMLGNDVAADPAGNSYVTGLKLPVADAYQPEPRGGDAFIVKLGPTGEVVYSTSLGGSGRDQGFGIAADPSGAVSVMGATYSSDFPKARPLPDGCVPRGGPCRFVARLGPTGENLDFATLFGRPWLTSTESGGEPIAAGPRGETYLVDGGPLVRFAANRPPDCAAAVVSPGVIWPPDGRMVPVAITGVTDPEGGEVELTVTSIFQDEPSTPGTDNAAGIGTPNRLFSAV